MSTEAAATADAFERDLEDNVPEDAPVLQFPAVDPGPATETAGDPNETTKAETPAQEAAPAAVPHATTAAPSVAESAPSRAHDGVTVGPVERATPQNQLPTFIGTEDLMELAQLNRDLDELEDEWKLAKRAARDAKEAFEDKAKEVRKFIKELYQPSLYNRPKKIEEVSKPAAETPKSELEKVAPGADSDPNHPIHKASKVFPQVDDNLDDWRGDMVDGLDLTEHLIQKLHDANIHSIGDLHDFTDPNKHGGKQQQITEIKGVGPKAAEKIEEAMMKYFEQRSARKAQEVANKVAEGTTLPPPEKGEEAPAEPDTAASDSTTQAAEESREDEPAAAEANGQEQSAE